MPKPMMFWTKAERFPPILVRLLAKHSGHNGRALGTAITNEEIAKQTGLTVYQVVSISNQTDWRGVDMPTMRAFTSACGVDLENARQMKRAVTYMRGKTIRAGGVTHRVPLSFAYLRRSPDWESFFKPLALRFFSSNKRT